MFYNIMFWDDPSKYCIHVGLRYRSPLIPFVMMAYCTVEHETSGCSPNYMMLGGEVATPLDKMYEKPSQVKHFPSNNWA